MYCEPYLKALEHKKEASEYYGWLPFKGILEEELEGALLRDDAAWLGKIVKCIQDVVYENIFDIGPMGMFFDLSDSGDQLYELEDLLVKNGISVPVPASMEEIVENFDEDPELLYTIIAEWCLSHPEESHLESPRERKAFTSELLCFAEKYGGASSFRLIYQELCL